LCQALRQQSIKGGYLRKSPNMFISALKGQLLTHQLIRLGPIELHTDADFISYQSMCSDLDKLRCVRNDGTNCTCRTSVPWMGALHGEWRIDLHISPTTWSFCSIVFAMIFYYKDFKTPKIIQFGALAGQIQHMASRKVGFTPRPIRYGSPNLLVSSSAALQSAYQV